MSDLEAARRGLVHRLLDGGGRASRTVRQAAFDHDLPALPEVARPLVEKLVAHSHEVIDEDIDALRATGLAEDVIFEIVVCAAVGEATREHEAGLRALAAALESP